MKRSQQTINTFATCMNKQFESFAKRMEEERQRIEASYQSMNYDNINQSLKDLQSNFELFHRGESRRLEDFKNTVESNLKEESKIAEHVREIAAITGESEEAILKRIMNTSAKKEEEKKTKVKLDLDGCLLNITTYNATIDETTEIMNDIKTKHTIFSPIKTKIELRYPSDDSNPSKYWNIMKDIALNTRLNHGLFVLVESNATNDINTGEIVLTYIFHFRNL